ncbi:MAG: glycosyltransferase, partial [Gammaproteobacteria bacterium]|nr:glycosyltransferase [Gammaproteobacteria bacterium]
YGNYLRFMRRWFVNHHTKNLYLLGVSNAIRDDIRHYLPHYPQEQIQTLYNRINIEQVTTDQLSRAEARRFLGLTDDQYVFANVGRLHPDKDQKTLINAFATVAQQLPHAILMIMGKGRLEAELKQQVKQLKLTEQVIFTGNVVNAVNYYRAFDNFILSSDYEPFGMVLLEAIMADVPVISTNVGGAKEIITDQQWLFDVGDDHALSQLMLKMSALDTLETDLLNQQNREFMEHNFTDAAVKDYFWNLAFIKSNFNQS